MNEWYHFALLPDGRVYVQWDEIGDFLVAANGEGILYAADPTAAEDSFHVFLLGQALSFALVKLGFEPLHATAVEIDGGAVAFLGASGFGKSTLAAGFHASGCRLLTDDMLVLHDSSSGYCVFPGPPRIKLLPDIAAAMLPAGSGEKLNSKSGKLVFPLNTAPGLNKAAPLRAIYQLDPTFSGPQPEGVSIEPMSPAEGLLSIVGNTFNPRLVDGPRLKRQAIAAGALARRVGVSRLQYPRDIEWLVEVRRAVISDLRDRAAPGRHEKQ